MTGPSPDEDLAQALSSLSARPDDRGAWRRLFMHLWPFVIGVAWRRLRDRTTSEDVAQDVFMRLVQSRPFASIADERQLKAYVWRMTINAANDHLKRKRHQTGHEASADAATTESVPDPGFLEDPMLYAEVLGLSREGLLPDEVRLLELMLSGKNLSEAAAELGQTYGVTATRLFRLRGKLNKLLFSG